MRPKELDRRHKGRFEIMLRMLMDVTDAEDMVGMLREMAIPFGILFLPAFGMIHSVTLDIEISGPVRKRQDMIHLNPIEKNIGEEGDRQVVSLEEILQGCSNLLFQHTLGLPDRE